MESNNQVFLKSTHQNIHADQKEGYSGIMLSFEFLRKTKLHLKKRGIPICLFDKSRSQNIGKCHILHEES